jgi:plastocyanin domain-containing protein
MLNRGLSMSGIGYDFRSVTTYLSHSVTRTAASLVGYQTIRMQVTAGGYEPDSFALEKGIPVRWIIEGKELNYCNHRIVVPAMGMEFDVQKGENVIEFTPGQVGVIPWSCWMGMISGNFLVHEKPAGEGATMGTGGLHSWRHGLEVWIKDWSERVERYLEH